MAQPCLSRRVPEIGLDETLHKAALLGLAIARPTAARGAMRQAAEVAARGR